jgi:von Willebrand factor type A domain
VSASSFIFAFVLCLAAAACSSDAINRPPGSADGTGGSGPSGIGPSGGNVGVGGGLGTGGGLINGGQDAGESDACGQQSFNLERRPAELLLVLDRSASMKDPPSGATASTSKWDLVVPAVNQVITETDSAVSWGMKAFPEGAGAECVATGVTNKIDVPLAPMNASKVTAAITSTTPEGNGTPTGDAIKQGIAYLGAVADNNPKYVLLATDGEPSCPSPSDMARSYAIQTVAEAAAAGFHVFVVGVSTTKATATTALNQMAVAGMEARPDPNPLATKFYLANTKDELVAAMKTITGQVSTCLFPLNSAPPVPDNIAVKVGGMKAPEDPTRQDGWDYTGPDHLGVQVYGSWCDAIKTTGANTVEIIFGCPGVIIR